MRHNGGVDVSVAVDFAKIGDYWPPQRPRRNFRNYDLLFGVQKITKSTATGTSIAPFDWKFRALSENQDKNVVAERKGKTGIVDKQQGATNPLL